MSAFTVARYTVSLTRPSRSLRCPHCHARARAFTYQPNGWAHGHTRYEIAHTASCTSRLFGTAVAAGAPFAPGEYIDGRQR